MDDVLDKGILNGLVDMHVHAGPSVAKRSFDAYEMLLEADAAGYKAFVVKDHYIPSILGTIMLNKHEGKRTLALGSLVLNNSVGGINVKMVDTCCNMGVKIVWMPTMSAKWDIDTRVGKFVGSGDSSVPEQPIYCLDENGEPNGDVLRLLEYLSQHKDIVLATGHCSIKETTALAKKAKEYGIEKIMVTHPYNTVKASFEEVKPLVDMGCYIELTAVCFKGVQGSEKFPVSMLAEYFENIPLGQLVIDSDLGAMTKAGPVSAVDGMYRFLNLLNSELGITESQIDVMAKETPSKRLGI
jgi:hypothetical protein